MLKTTLIAGMIAGFAGTAAFAGDCNWGKHAEMTMAETVPEASEPAVLPDLNLTQVASLACAELSGEALLACIDTQKAAVTN